MSIVAELPPFTTERPPITADDLLGMSDGDRFELVNGELVERNMGWESECIGTNVLGLLWTHCLKHGCGYVNGSSASYQCFDEVYPDDPERTRKPDVSFISIDRLPADRIPKGHCDIVPDLAVEVVSPNDLYHEVEEKVEEYLAAGVRLVWVVNPHTKSIRIHRANRTVEDLQLSDELSGEEVIPGFRCPVSDIFRLPTKTPMS